MQPSSARSSETPWTRPAARRSEPNEAEELEPLPLLRRSSKTRVDSRRRHTMIGTLVQDRYRLESFLGEGGTATVHLARDLETMSPVVIKRMKPSVATQPELRMRFVLEAKLLSRIDHPLVVRALDVQEPDDDAPFLVLEALGGETLGEYLRREEVMPAAQALPLIRDAAIALSAVHEAGVIHRDIKPDNLFLVGAIGAPRSVKVLDFGMAHFADDQGKPGGESSKTSILGTAQYMAPEQILVEPVDARTDVYGLGVVMFRMLTGHLPFDAQSKKDLLRHQLFSPVPPATWLNDELSEDIARIVRHCTRKCPTRRPESMPALLAELERVAQPSFELVSEIAPAEHPSAPEFEWGDYESDIYTPRTERGRQAAAILAREFGVYSRPHSPVPPSTD